jgi:4-hydroxy-tetrahydrodipicolinate reductase
MIGMGKMGQAVTSLLEQREDASFHAFHHLTSADLSELKSCDVAIEFTTSESAPDVIRLCLESGIPIVSGTTGWHLNHLQSVIEFCANQGGKFLYASNFSIGMNITFALNRKLASIMNQFPQFSASISEIHHIHKKDSPSGTALSLIQDIIALHDRYTSYQLKVDDPDLNSLPVTAIREGEVKGFHEVTWSSSLEQIRLSHEALDRKIFAEGAILAASWLIGQNPGVYTMKDIIDV